MTPESSLAATVVNHWTLTLARAQAVFLGKTHEQLQQVVAPGKNRLIYLFGHLIAVHDGMLPMLGLGDRLHPELDAAFLDEADSPAAHTPSAAELERLWVEVHAALAAGFARLSPADWTQRHTAMSDADFAANPLRNRAAVVMNRASHMAYHLGQCALVVQAHH